MIHNWFKKLVGFLVIILVGIFIIRIFVSQAIQIQASIHLVSWINIVLSVLMFLGYFYARALSWNLILTSLGNHLELKDGLFAWFAGESTRYIPGNVWSFASRFYLTHNKGIPKTNIVLSMLLEIMILLPVSLLLSIPALWANYGKVQFNLVTVLAIIIILGLMIGVLLFSSKAKNLLKELQHIPKKIFLTKSFLGTIIFQIIAWGMFGLGSYFLIQPFAQHMSVALLVSISVFSWFLGYVSIITPMGLGVREGAIILLLGSNIGPGPASLAAILSRVVLTAAEGMNVLFWLYIHRKK